MTTRRVLAAGLLLVLAAAVVAVDALRGPRQDGPLQTNSRFNITFALADGA